MKAIIPGTNARVFAKAIQSLAKIGPDLFMEAEPDGLSIRTVSSTKSAFAMIKFHESFFTDYEIEEETDDEFMNKCKVSMKACTGVFRNMKQVELCRIKIDSTTSKLIVQLKCRLETIKTHSISILDFETLQAVYLTDNVPNVLTASNKLFSEISNNFQMQEEEITMEAIKDSLTIKNYVEGSHVDRKFMRTQLSLNSSEFDKYRIDEETSVTFCLREFRALLAFAEAINMDMTVNFETAGRPVVFILNNLHTFVANLVMSTLSPDDITNLSIENNATHHSIQSTSSHCDIRKRNSQTSEMPSISKTTASKRRKPITSSNDDREESSNSNEILFNFPSRRNEAEKEIESIDLVRNDCDNSNVEVNIETQISLPIALTHNRTQSDLANNKESEGIHVSFRDTDELMQDIETVPKSPTAVSRIRRTRKIFQRCFEATFDPRKLPGASQILAPSSDTED